MDFKTKNKIVILVIVILIIGFACIFININKNNVAIDKNSSETLNIIKEENSYTIYDKSGENIIAQNLTEEETKMYIENPNYSLDPRTVK